MWAIIKKEFKSYFLSPIGYIYIGVFLLTCSIFFYLDIFVNLSTDFPYMFGISSDYINIYSAINYNENVLRRKKKWNRTIITNIAKKHNTNSIRQIYCSSISCISFSTTYTNILWNTKLF